MTNTVEPDAPASMTDDLGFWKARAKSYQARLSAVEAENEKLRQALQRLNTVIQVWWKAEPGLIPEAVQVVEAEREAHALLDAQNALGERK